MESEARADAMAESWNVNAHNAGFWDPHMTLSMFQWLRSQNAYDDTTLKAAMKKVYSCTHLVDGYERTFGEPAPQEMNERASRMKAEFVSIEVQLKPFLSCMITAGRERQDGEAVTALERKTIKEWNAVMQARQNAAYEESLRNNGDAEPRRERPKVQPFPENVLELLLQYCQICYASGEYSFCKRWLLFYLDHVCEFTVEGRERTDLRLKCCWGLVAAMLMMLPTPRVVDPASIDDQQHGEGDSSEVNRHDDNPDDAYLIARNLLAIEDYLEPIKNSRKSVLMEKSWLLHWSVWALMRYYFPKVLSSGSSSSPLNPRAHIPCHIEWTRLIDWLFNEQTLCVMAALTPQLLRYIAVVAILNRQRQDHFKAAVEMISRTSPKFSDPFTAILESLFVKFDFDEAQEKLARCGEAAHADFLLAPLEASIEEHARLLIFQTYCRIQKSINIDMIAKKLHMTAETAERWIVNLIRNARLEAKIDSERNRVEIASPSPNVYQQVLDKARNLVVRTSVLVQNVDRPVGTSTTTAAVPRGEFGNFRRGGNRGVEFGGNNTRGGVDFATGGSRTIEFGGKRAGNR